jgi:predicted Zn finger-like uncharacterized protein
MDIACPRCAVTYRVPEALVASGKALRCAACGQEWVPQASRPEPPAPSVRPPRPPPAASPPPASDAAPEARPDRRLTMAWAASLATVALGLAALVVFRAPIAAAWPPFARLGAMLGG